MAPPVNTLSSKEKTIECENVNGAKLTLKVEMREVSPQSRRFTLSYKNERKNSKWPKFSLVLAVLFNVLALFYIQISLLAIVITLSVLSVLYLMWITHCVQSESVMVIPTVGIQSTVKYILGADNNFIPWSTVDDIVINEVIKVNRVLHYLTILIKTCCESDSMNLVPLFRVTKPRLPVLEIIYSELQALLTEAHSQQPFIEAGDMG